MQDFRDIRKNNKMSNVFTLKGQGQEVEERDLCHSIGNFRLQIGDFDRNCGYLQHTFTKGEHTHTHSNIETWVVTIDKIFKADLAKKQGLMQNLLRFKTNEDL